ncbi:MULTISPECIES: DUF2312 domain-containing protein [Mesorhizobium]|uniref:GapR-like DNA-binding domain-containing protein n=2 Tax=Mesorhizobium TaxID=68287 RepID=A0A1A5J595_RHILI|nr:MULTISPECIES: DUF2312 domain-containing protein [Mesorhizobium]ETA72309.1 hypothetical protein MesloDRAFT_1178 [Mesorhizobium japonicum R7A]MBE1709641.1 DUF2312 domain-containing protein [Mesorhizobium japonicum]MBE1714310.1 DUF2312 domain-containing protein [Mesorhizobium japonicum]MUT25291.1 DUF2312 domain-containing protein [Mesorhizobium japonicum]MUT28655.1 DUF2312 domain-containing protein [Mesorhizobium japonicum]
MTDITETSQTVAAGQLRAFVDRILRLKEEQDTIGDDIKEVYAELKGCGFDRTAVGSLVAELRKKAKTGIQEFEERNSILDLYRLAYEDACKPQAHARARTRENIEEFPADKRADGGAKIAAKHQSTATELPPHDAETGEIIEQNSSDLTSSPEKTNTAGAEPPPSAPATNSEIPDHATSGAADGQPSKPSSEAARAKSDGPQKTVIGQEGPVRGHSEQAVTNSDADIPAFLKKAPSPAPNPDCQKPQSCRWSHSQASCAKCANDAAIARQRGRAA